MSLPESGAQGQAAGGGLPRGLVLYSAAGALEGLVEGVAEGMRRAGMAVEAVRADQVAGAVLAVGGVAVLCVGSPVVGLWRGRPAADVVAALQRCQPLAGRRAAVFVRRRWGQRTALLELMAELERQGVWVEDFEALGSREQAVAFGQRLSSLLRPRFVTGS